MESPCRNTSTSRSLHLSCPSLFTLLSLIFLVSGTLPQSVMSLGINYGQIANNLPSPDKVIPLVKTIGATKVKLYDADPKVLKAFAKSEIEFTVTVGNNLLPQLAKDPKQALDWVKKNVQCYLPDTNITCILIGNEVLTFNDTTLTSSLYPAMQNMHSALQTLDLDGQVWVTTAHNLAILQTSFPPSAGSFRQDLAGCLTQILNFHAKTGSPFLINAYPYFAYKGSPEEVSLDYVLFQPKNDQIMVDPDSSLHYENMLYAQVDAVYSAMGQTFRKKVQVQVSETGWPSKGDEDEFGATPDNAKKYIGNLIKLVSNSDKKGTPMKPNSDLNVYVFALFNENMKPGPSSERNYGLFKPDGTPVYSLGFPAIQAVSNNNTSGSSSGAGGPSAAGLTSDGSRGGDDTSSSGYLSISFAMEKQSSVGLSITSLVLCWVCWWCFRLD